MKYPSGFVYILLFAACNQAHQNQLPVADQVTPKKTAKHILLPGTHTFAKVPDGYTLIPSLVRLQKNDGTYFQLAEVPGANFASREAELEKVWSAVSQSKVKMRGIKKFRLGAFDALIVCGPDDNPEKEQMVMAYGNTHFVSMAVGIFKKDDETTFTELLDMMTSLVTDTSITPDFSGFQTFTLDNSHTDFKYLNHASQLFVYTTKPGVNISEDVFSDQVMVGTYPPMDSLHMKELSISIIKRYVSGGMQVTISEEHFGRVQDMPAYITTFTTVFKGKTASCYQVITGNEKSCLFFCGSAYTNPDRYMEAFKSMAGSIRIKP